MVQVISNLGSSPSLDAVTVIRPVFVSLAFAILLPLACRFIVLPTTKFVASKREENRESAFNKLAERELTALVIHTCILVATVAGATYAGSSALLGAYIAGAMISWWDAEAPHPRVKEATASASVAVPEAVEMTNVPSDAAPQTTIPSTDSQASRSSNSGAHVFDKYYAPSLQRILKPFFFVSGPVHERVPLKLTRTGIRWLLDPYHADVHWLSCVARSYLHRLDDSWKASMWSLASACA